MTDRVLGVGYLATTSYLPGSEPSPDLPAVHARACADGMRVELRSTVESAPELVGKGALACSVSEAVSSWTFRGTPLSRLRIALVPSGFGYEERRLSIGFRPVFAGALRQLDDHAADRSHFVRMLAHELLHLHLALGAKADEPLPDDPAEERAAALIENCVELQVLGSTHGDSVPEDAWRTAADSLEASGSTFSDSVAGSGAASQELSSLGLDLPVRASDPVASRRLLETCRRALRPWKPVEPA